MTEDHETKLAALAEKLAGVFLDAADPNAWTGAGVAPAEQDKDVRGNRQWDIKNANQIGLLFARSLELRQRVRYFRQLDEPPGGEQAPVPDAGPIVDPDADIKRFEKEAGVVLARLQTKR